MPDEDAIRHYFDLYFTHVHPYVPVLNKLQLYRQWNTNRESISPLLLEAIFAVAERLADEPAQGQQWIALASSKSCSYFDIMMIRLWPILTLTLCRTCRFLHGCPTVKYPPSTSHHSQGPGSSAKAWLLLQVVDVHRPLCGHGTGSGPRRTFPEPQGRKVMRFDSSRLSDQNTSMADNIHLRNHDCRPTR